MDTNKPRRSRWRVAVGVPALCMVAFAWLCAYTVEFFVCPWVRRTRVYFHEKFEATARWVEKEGV